METPRNTPDNRQLSGVLLLMQQQIRRNPPCKRDISCRATIGRPQKGSEFAGISDINATDPAGRETRPLHLSMWVRCKIYQASP